MDTRQSDHKIWPLLACLPSVLGVALGKVYKLCRVFSSWHSANLRNFAECFRVDTQQSWETFPSVFLLTLGKLEKLCRVFSCWHSAKLRNFAECFRLDTRQTWETLPSVFPSCTRQNRRHRVIPSKIFCREFIFAECLLILGAIKNTRQNTVYQ